MKYKLNKTLLPLAALGVCMNAYASDEARYSDYQGSMSDQDTDIEATSQSSFSDYYDSMSDQHTDLFDRQNEMMTQETELMTIPAHHEGIRASISYLLGQPTYNSGFVDVTSDFPVENIGRVRPAFTQSGLATELAYDFSNGKFIQADWMQFLGNTQSVNSGGTMTVPESGIPENPFFDLISTGRTRSTFLRLGADVGQTFNAGENLLYRLSFGLQYARIGITENSLINVSEVQNGILLGESQTPLFNRKSTFNGIGPRVGLGAEYDIGWNFKLVGHTAASLNIGNIKATTSSSTFNPDAISVGDLSDLAVTERSTDSFRTVVPGLEGNLGVRYDYDFSDNHGILSTEVGYQAMGYFNSFSGTRDALSADGTSINSPSTYANHAVYLKLGYNGGFVS